MQTDVQPVRAHHVTARQLRVRRAKAILLSPAIVNGCIALVRGAVMSIQAKSRRGPR